MFRNLQLIRSIFQPFHKVKANYNTLYYNSLFSQYDNSKAYLDFFKTCIHSKSIKTNVEISFNKTIKFGCKINSLKRAISSSNYHIYKNKELNTTIILFRIFFGQHKVKCQMHFFDNKLFFYNYLFSEATNSQIIELIKVLEEKYTYGVELNNGTNIIDSSNNCINIENNTLFTINYLSMDSNFFNILTASELKQTEKLCNINTKYAKLIYSRL